MGHFRGGGGGEKTVDKLFVKMEKEKFRNEIHGTRRYFTPKISFVIHIHQN